MIEEIKNIKGTVKDCRNFGLLVGGVFFVLGLLSLYKGHTIWHLTLPLGFGLIILGYFFASALRPAYTIWMGIAVVMGWVVTHVILTVFFFVCIGGISLVAKIFGKKFLDADIRPSDQSYWIKHSVSVKTPADLEKQF